MARELAGMQAGRGDRPEEAHEAGLRLQVENLGGSRRGVHTPASTRSTLLQGQPHPQCHLALLAHM